MKYNESSSSRIYIYLEKSQTDIVEDEDYGYPKLCTNNGIPIYQPNF
jgi:hypothetical protein